jgi:hypothetical protein
VAKLNGTGSQLIYGATVGSNSIIAPPRLFLDSSANAFITGTGDYCCDGNTGIIGPLGGIGDFWVVEINAAGNALLWSVAIGGSDDDEEAALAIDRANKLYIAGYSASLDFPTTPGAVVQPGAARTLVVKLDPSKPPASSMVYSALIGNPGNNSNDFISGQAIAVDRAGNAYVGAWMYNRGLFTSPWAFQSHAPTVPNGYVFELNQSGGAITNGTYLGGGLDDYVSAVSVDNAGNTYVSGVTDS